MSGILLETLNREKAYINRVWYLPLLKEHKQTPNHIPSICSCVPDKIPTFSPHKSLKNVFTIFPNLHRIPWNSLKAKCSLPSELQIFL